MSVQSILPGCQIQAIPNGISFNCSALPMDPKMVLIFTNMLKNQSHLDTIRNPSCPSGKNTEACGNQRGNLSECRCPLLNRATHPEIRQGYEDEVIETIIKMIKPSKNQFHFKLAMFGSGWLLGEQILLVKLLQRLNEQNASGTLEVFCIDTDYTDSIKSGNPTTQMNQFLGELRQFPSKVHLIPAFFGDASTYIEAARANPHLKHDLLIGADSDGAHPIMGAVGREAGLGQANPIALIKVGSPGAAQICQLDSMGNLINCHDPQAKNGGNWKIVAGISAAVLVILLIYLAKRKKSDQ